LLNNNVNNLRQAFIDRRGLFLFEAFIAHLYESLLLMGALQLRQILDPLAGAKRSRRPICVSIFTGSRRSMTQKLFRFRNFGIPFL
jgi:hypothetical protein